MANYQQLFCFQGASSVPSDLDLAKIHATLLRHRIQQVFLMPSRLNLAQGLEERGFSVAPWPSVGDLDDAMWPGAAGLFCSEEKQLQSVTEWAQKRGIPTLLR